MSEKPGELELPEDHDARMAHACKRARWHLGYGSWAELIIAAYLNPKDDDVDLEAVMSDV